MLSAKLDDIVMMLVGIQMYVVGAEVFDNPNMAVAGAILKFVSVLIFLAGLVFYMIDGGNDNE